MSDLGTPIDIPTIPASGVDLSISPLALCVVPFRLTAGRLEVGTEQRGDLVLLPSGDPALEESLDDAARQIICDAPQHCPLYIEQLYTFSLNADSFRQIVISYVAIFRESVEMNASSRARLDWSSVRSVRLDRPLDRAVLGYAITRLRAKLGYTNIAFHLMPQSFTLTELQHAYECVLEHPVDKRNFRRRMTATGILDDTGEKRREGSHRPAALYRFASRDDQAAYLTPPWALERLDSDVEEGE